MIKKLSSLYLFAALTIPTAYALADGTDDHSHAEAVTNPGGRIYVMIGLGVVFLLMLAYIINAKMKSKAPMGNDAPPTEPQ